MLGCDRRTVLLFGLHGPRPPLNVPRFFFGLLSAVCPAGRDSICPSRNFGRSLIRLRLFTIAPYSVLGACPGKISRSATQSPRVQSPRIERGGLVESAQSVKEPAYTGTNGILKIQRHLFRVRCSRTGLKTPTVKHRVSAPRHNSCVSRAGCCRTDFRTAGNSHSPPNSKFNSFELQLRFYLEGAVSGKAQRAGFCSCGECTLLLVELGHCILESGPQHRGTASLREVDSFASRARGLTMSRNSSVSLFQSEFNPSQA